MEQEEENIARRTARTPYIGRCRRRRACCMYADKTTSFLSYGKDSAVFLYHLPFWRQRGRLHP